MTDAYKNFIEFEADTLSDTNVFYATIIATLNEQLKEANEIMKHYANDENWCNYYDDVDENMTKAIYIGCDGTLKASIYLKKWGVK